MGCDIHLHIEIKIAGVWHHYGHPKISRNYDLFQKMAGVRGDEREAIASPRGLPADITKLTAYSAEHDKGKLAHSHSYLDAGEISSLEDWLREFGPPGRFGRCDLDWDILNCYLFGNSFGGFAKYPDERPEGLEDLRFVFWFDN